MGTTRHSSGGDTQAGEVMWGQQDTAVRVDAVRGGGGGGGGAGTVRHSRGGDTQVGETLQWWRHSSGEVVWGQRDTPVVETPKRGR